MANSRYEYVKQFEHDRPLLPDTFIIVRIDGRGFHKISAKYDFRRPNDQGALDLMNEAATSVMKEFPDITMAYGLSDEYSFVFDKSCTLFDRRESKILTSIVSTFTSYFVQSWPSYFPKRPLSSPMPSFDGRVVLYPSAQSLRDYLSWRQVDCHINNLYNTTFWALVDKGRVTNIEAEKQLKGTQKAEKNEIMFRLGINYNNEPEIYRKGSMLYREASSDSDIIPLKSPTRLSAEERRAEKECRRARIVLVHTDIIQDGFWTKRPWLIAGSS